MSLIVRNDWDLGAYSYGNSSANFQLKEENKITIHPFAKGATRPNKTASSLSVTDVEVQGFYHSLCKTRSFPNYFLCLFVPTRTHTWKDLALDICVPLSRRWRCNMSADHSDKVVLVVLAIVDILTILVRLLISPFATVYQTRHPHSARRYLNKVAADAVYVKCEKTLTIIAEDVMKVEKPKAEIKLTAFWRVDLISPLSKFSYYENFFSSIVNSAGNPLCYTSTTQNNTHNMKFFGHEASTFVKKDDTIIIKLSDMITNKMLPNLTFC